MTLFLSDYYFLKPAFLWCCLGVSAVFLLAAVNLGVGIWTGKRRRLLPWLLVTGVTILFMITATVWLMLRNRYGYISCVVVGQL